MTKKKKKKENRERWRCTFAILHVKQYSILTEIPSGHQIRNHHVLPWRRPSQQQTQRGCKKNTMAGWGWRFPPQLLGEGDLDINYQKEVQHQGSSSTITIQNKKGVTNHLGQRRWGTFFSAVWTTVLLAFLSSQSLHTPAPSSTHSCVQLYFLSFVST